MKYFRNNKDFEENMKIIKNILEIKGYIVESDHNYAYKMQYSDAFEDVKDWLYKQGYDGNLIEAGAYHGVAVYGLYDDTKVTLEEMQNELRKEAKRQLKEN